MSNSTACENGERSLRVVEPCFLDAAGDKPTKIAEYIGRLGSGDTALSIAMIASPPGWFEPPQTPEFDEFILVLRGELRVTAQDKTEIVRAGRAVHVPRGLRVQYATLSSEGAEYVAVCRPAFAPDQLHREDVPGASTPLLPDGPSANLVAAYDAVAEEYAARWWNEFEYKHFDRIMLGWYASQVPDGQTVLEIGCGPGEVSGYLSKLGVRCIGTDLSPRMIDNAWRIFPYVTLGSKISSSSLAVTTHTTASSPTTRS